MTGSVGIQRGSRREVRLRRPQDQDRPAVSAAQWDRVKGCVKIGEEEGATVVLGGMRAVVGDWKGHFYQPTILTGI